MLTKPTPRDESTSAYTPTHSEQVSFEAAARTMLSRRASHQAPNRVHEACSSASMIGHPVATRSHRHAATSGECRVHRGELAKFVIDLLDSDVAVGAARHAVWPAAGT